MSTQLTTPTITLTVVDKTTVRVSGLSVPNASGYQVKIGTLSGGQPIIQVSPVDGVVKFSRLLPRSVYYISARALGDDVDILTSDWTDETSVVTGTIIDNNLPVPQIALAPAVCTALKVTGLTESKEYRYQIATTADGLDSAAPKCIGSRDGTATLMCLEPGTTYFVRFCLVEIDKCSVWSDVVSAATTSVTDTIVVTSGDDAGTGTLRQAISDATGECTKIVLNVAEITLNSVITDTTKRLFIVGGLSERTVIKPGNSNKLLQLSYVDYRFIKFTGDCGANSLVQYGYLSDCIVEDAVTTQNNGVIYQASLGGCHLSGNYSTQGTAVSLTINDCVFSGCRSSGANGAANSSILNNCVVTNCIAGSTSGGVGNSVLTNCSILSNTASANGGGCNGCTLISCTISNNYGNHGGGAAGGSAYNCIFTDNTAAQNGGGTNATNLTSCLVTRNKCLGPTAGTANSGCGGGTNGGTITDCEITYNTSTQEGGGCYSGTLSRCVITDNYAGANGGGCGGDSTKTDCFISRNTAVNYGGGAYSGTLTRCLVTDNTSGSVGGGSCSSRLNSSLLYGNKQGANVNDYAHYINYDRTVTNATIGVISGVYRTDRFFMRNTLYKSRSHTPTGADVNNIAYGDNEDDYFADAENGNYRLKYGSPAINAGDNEYVTTETDLAGNPRIGNGTVDVGCYEYAPYPLAPPTYSIEFAAGGQGTVSYTLPDLSSGFCLQYSSSEDFADASEITSESTGFDLSGLTTGWTYFRAKALGTADRTLDSPWTTPQRIYVDASAPLVVVDTTPIEITYGELTDLLADVSVSDDTTDQPTLHYQILGSDGNPITVDGSTTDPSSDKVPKGRYTLRISATDTIGNVGTGDRGLVVMPPRLTTPTIALRSVYGTTAIISGCLNNSAAGWVVSVDGVERPIIPNEAGQITLTGLGDNQTHIVKAKALGDYTLPDPPEEPTGDWRDSLWSTAITVVIGGPSPGNAPVISQSEVTDRSVTIAVTNGDENLGYYEILIGEDAAFGNPALISRLPAGTVTITGLKSNKLYWLKLRGMYASDATPYSNTIIIQTAELGAVTLADKLAYVRSRIQLLRDYLAESANLSTISIDGISETRVDRSALRAELEALEAEESRLMSGGGRLRTIDARWVI